jgi:hypothetical protein
VSASFGVAGAIEHHLGLQRLLVQRRRDKLAMA